MTSSKDTSPDARILEACNHTELYSICRDRGIQIPPSTPSADMILYILGEAEPPTNSSNNVDSWRHGIMGFLLDHWDVVQSQLACPAKSKDPRSCFQCTDQMVLSCVVDNKTNEELIQLHRKREP